MNELVKLWEKPSAKEIYMILGWRQWADAGSISSELPLYLVEQTRAQKIGEINPDGFYMFQIPGTHHFLRPEVNLEDGYCKEVRLKKNEIFYAGDEDKGVLIFLGDEPHLNEEVYGEALFQIATEFNVKRAVALGGVYGAMPYNKDRQVSCSYSLMSMKEELTNYAVRFSNYEGGATIGSYLLQKAAQKGVEYLTIHALVPAYDLSQLSIRLQGMSIDTDYKAWYDIMRRLDYMFKLDFDFDDLERRSEEVRSSMDAKIQALEEQMPQLDVRDYLARVAEDFTEMTFEPLDEVWVRGLDDLDLFDDLDS